MDAPLGLTWIDLLAWMSGGAAFLLMVAVYNSLLLRDPMRGRLRTLNERRQALIQGLSRPTRRKSSVKRVDGVSLMRAIAHKLKLLQSRETRTLTDKLAAAGWRSRDALVIYQVSRLAGPLVLGLVALVLLKGVGILPGLKTWHPLIAATFVLLGFKLPDLMVENRRRKRHEAIGNSLPDALDLLVVCAESGLTLDAALGRVAREMKPAAPDLSEEFELTAIELGFLPDRRQALTNLMTRVDLPALRGVVTTLIQSERYGTPLAAALRVLAAEFRNDRLMAAEEKAARLPATLTVPLIVFILPTLFIVLLGPATCRISDDLVGM
ncbi:type II secretion system F family protein [Yunchengibacter salinarum]|uniref:type II secretion system F family protein n=1 Tax=Yunchengibacter salinarum TaxID=3133399 RepID=UPI0035B5A3BF